MEPLHYLQQITEANFKAHALATFERQYAGISVYRRYVDMLGKTNPKNCAEIPFLPIDFFKSQQIYEQSKAVVKTFKSSGTSQQMRSQHQLTDLSWYQASLTLGFERVFGALPNFVFIAILPSYLENGDSSLIYMVNQLMLKSDSIHSGYYLSELEQVNEVYQKALAAHKTPFIIGVSYALLDLAEMQLKLPDALILETGGMKGRRPEQTKDALHAVLQDGFGVSNILSEYGMTELLSQAYCTAGQVFSCPPWMQIQIRDASDPFQEVPFGQKGGINIIDLANQNSCAFIQTDDLGRLVQGGFMLEGRMAASDVRGCNQLVD